MTEFVHSGSGLETEAEESGEDGETELGDDPGQVGEENGDGDVDHGQALQRHRRNSRRTSP